MEIEIRPKRSADSRPEKYEFRLTDNKPVSSAWLGAFVAAVLKDHKPAILPMPHSEMLRELPPKRSGTDGYF